MVGRSEDILCYFHDKICFKERNIDTLAQNIIAFRKYKTERHVLCSENCIFAQISV